MSAEEQAPPPQPAVAASGISGAEISRRLGSVLDAVEEEAARLRAEARAEAAAYLEQARHRADGLVAERQRRISELSDELLAKSESVVARLDDAGPVQHGFESLVRALGNAAERLAAEAESSATDFRPPPFGAGAAYQPPPAAGGGPGTNAQPRPPVQGPAGLHSPARRGPGARAADPALDEARVVAIQMAASGATRGGVRERLLSGLGFGDPDGVLDAVFGPGSGEDARVPWIPGRR